MAIASEVLIRIIEETRDRLIAGADYQWSHFGKCNCGQLAQTATRLSASSIHREASARLQEWSEIPEDFCPQTGVLVDRIIDTLFEIGLAPADLRHLEDLSDPLVLRRLPGGHRFLSRNKREDTIAYLEAWAGLLRQQLAAAPPVIWPESHCPVPA